MDYESIVDDDETLFQNCQANQSGVGRCTSCLLGDSCCAEMSDTRSQSDSASSNAYTLDEEEERSTDLDVEVGLAEGELSDSEILQRLFYSTIDSSMVEEPLSVIWENPEEEDKSDSSSLALSEIDSTPLMTLEMDCQPESDREEEAMPLLVPTNHVKENISIDKANDLICEIENCFIETAMMVEKTLVKSQESSRDGRTSSTSSLAISEKDQGVPRDRLSQTIQDTMNIFDSLISIRPVSPDKKHDDYVSTSDYSTLADDRRRTSFADSNDEFCYHETKYMKEEERIINNNIDVDEHTNPSPHEYNEIPCQHENDLYIPQIESKLNDFIPHKKNHNDEIDRLFHECYDITAIEPSTTLDACLRNLQRLCLHLQNTRNSIVNCTSENNLNEKIEQSLYDEPSCDSLFKESMNLIRHERFSVINELIERAITRRKVAERCIPSPPIMGFEGMTHRKIIDDIPLKSTKENALLTKENFDSMDSFCKSLDTATHHNVSKVQLHMNQNYSENSLDNVTDEDENHAMTYDETLELYKDNQELQESLLSILHSLNDIHDNFLNRRREESYTSQKNSGILHTKIINLLSENKSKEADVSFHDYVNFPVIEKGTTQFELEADFDAIHKIIEISEELKHLWQTQFRDIRKTPQRTRSFKQKQHPVQEDNWRENKCLSMPNLCQDIQEWEDMSSMEAVRSFIDNLREENRRCYEITLNFLRKIMNIYSVSEAPVKFQSTFIPQRHEITNLTKIH